MGRALLVAEGIGVGHPDAPPLLAGTGFSLEGGDALVLLGANGSGKSTLLRCLLGLVRPLAGRVTVAGHDVHAMTAPRRAALLAYVPQTTIATFPFRVREVVLMGRSRHLRFLADPDAADHVSVAAALRSAGIEHLAERRFDTLSGGERQLALLARALAQDAPCLLLDEPCANLDPRHEVAVLDTLRHAMRRGRAVVMATHAPQHAWALDARALLLGGDAQTGAVVGAASLGSETLSRLYGTPIESLVLADGAAAGRRVLVPMAMQAAR